MNRKETIARLKSSPRIPVLIIGGGINGIGTFRDLSLQGVECLLVDKGDFCSGASMASSHMLHGGIRYLENGEFRLVKEALHERNHLLRNAPHLTHPLPTTIPIFKWFSGIWNAPLKFLGLLDRPAERGAVIIKLGLMMYDAYVRDDSPMPGHRMEPRKKALSRWPQLNQNVLFAATYYDGGMYSPERLALEILLDGEAEGDHARAANYLEAVGVAGEGVLLKDHLSGEEFPVFPQMVVNAGGPWIDLINQRIDGDTGFIGGTKGSHLIVDHPELRDALGGHEFFFEYLDGRIVLIYPYLDHVLIGTTDIRIEHPDEVEITADEIDYILGMVPHVFPGIKVSLDQVIFQFTGVRPLPRAEGSTGQVSRDHSLRVMEKGDQAPWPILNLIGGKWTSYRAFSEQVTDQVLERLGLVRREDTANLPIGGGAGYPEAGQEQETWIDQTAEQTGLPPSRITTLLERYGTRAKKIALAAGGTEQPLDHLPDYTRSEISYLTENEMITRLDDFILRRSLTAWNGRVSWGLLAELAAVIGSVLDWDPQRQQIEADRCAKILQINHRVRL